MLAANPTSAQSVRQITTTEDVAPRRVPEPQEPRSERRQSGQTATSASAAPHTQTVRQVSELLGLAAHELRSPVTASKLSVQLAARRLDVLQAHAATRDDALAGQLAALQGLLGRAGASVERLNRLIDDLLDVTRIHDGGHLPLHLAPCDLTALVCEVVEEQRQIAPTRAIWLQEPARPIVCLSADADRIRQVVTNYLVNALRYSPEDRPIEVRMRRRGSWVHVAVRDQGPGVPPEERERIWERFYRADGVPAASDIAGGLGLGLYICRLIVEQHQGRYGLRSAPGHGSTFWFALPLIRSDA